MRIGPWEIKRIVPKWATQRNMYWRCPVCKEVARLKTARDGRTLFQIMLDEKTTHLDQMTLTCGICGSKITFMAADEIAVQIAEDKGKELQKASVSGDN
jgi:transcription elongation factor Elf1